MTPSMNELILRGSGRLPPVIDTAHDDEFTQQALELGCVDPDGLRQLVPGLEGVSGMELRPALIRALRERPHFAGDTESLETAIKATAPGSADLGAREGDSVLGPPNLTELIVAATGRGSLAEADRLLEHVSRGAS